MDGPLKVLLVLVLLVVPAAAGPVAAPGAADALQQDGGSSQVNGDAPQQATVGSSQQEGLPKPVVNETNTTSYLALPEDDIRTSRFGTVRLDVAGSIGLDDGRLQTRYATIRLRETYKARESRSGQRAVVERTTDRLDDRIENLTTRQQAAIRRYNAGQLSTRAFLRELAIVDRRAKTLADTIAQLNTYNRAADTPVPETRLARLKARLIPLRGPVRSEAANAMRGDDGTPPTRIHVETSDDGVVLAMVRERPSTVEYVREAFDGDGFDEQFAEKPIELSVFRDRIRDRYRWIAEQDPASDTVLTRQPFYSKAGIYGIRYNHQHGTARSHDLTIYYDAGTDQVFREIQYENPEAVPTEEVANETSEGLRIRVYATRPGGSLLVNVTGATAGSPERAIVRIDGEVVGETGPRGRLWTIAPRGSFETEATVVDRNVTATAET
jgi:hypothetical protein